MRLGPTNIIAIGSFGYTIIIGIIVLAGKLSATDAALLLGALSPIFLGLLAYFSKDNTKE